MYWPRGRHDRIIQFHDSTLTLCACLLQGTRPRTKHEHTIEQDWSYDERSLVLINEIDSRKLYDGNFSLEVLFRKLQMTKIDMGWRRKFWQVRLFVPHSQSNRLTLLGSSSKLVGEQWTVDKLSNWTELRRSSFRKSTDWFFRITVLAPQAESVIVSETIKTLMLQGLIRAPYLKMTVFKIPKLLMHARLDTTWACWATQFSGGKSRQPNLVREKNPFLYPSRNSSMKVITEPIAGQSTVPFFSNLIA